ncbi:DEAD/DEAH box helicase family protein [Aliarcobacter cryaerophilus]|uniref:DEAD/DEAH box helicase family protein n=1 Tax=Aliarcobacter cryaerophilus TaxID=28198 RepID=UPI000824C4AD|nr:DEAD/DEAH box helicase family protein [Aliarcobacter cryaerophilus]
MSNIKNLYEIINTQKEALKSFNPEVFEIPKYITSNLKYELFSWQIEALENFLFYENPKSKLQKKPTHLMFNLATGTGKTLLMASTILYYYNKGYKHFIFFVNQNNIVDKTENNFIDSSHNKYLYKDKIVMNNDETVEIKKVDTFSDNPQGIEIKFTTIQKLYNDIHIERENQTTLDDLISKNIVMLADEAHHLNANTSNQKFEIKELIETELKENASQSDIEKKGWEHTVIELILNKNGSKEENKNILLEFTATIPENDNVAKKYADKIIYKFGLKEFLDAGYTKEINLISSTLEKKERILQALLFNWYRYKIALKNNIPNFKPVILFRSRTIEESEKDYEDFLNIIESINLEDFNFLKIISDKISQSKSIYEQGKSRTEQVIDFINNHKISYMEIIEYLKNNFVEKNLIITNSKYNKTQKEKTTEDQEKLLNSLEDKNNHIRAIFTVDRLTEGWDVLNLFDIVRLYQGQNAGGNDKKTPQATTKEKQLIGRGVRYFPFTYKDKIPNKRKFDEDLNNELRVLEELYYYTYDEESRYISHLKNELRKDGYIRDDKVIKTFKLKQEFVDSEFYKNTYLWYNTQIDNPSRRRKTLEDIKKDFFVPYRVKGLEISEQELAFDNNEDIERLHITEGKTKTISIKFSEIEKHIFRKAINIKAKQENSLFQFENLKKELQIITMDDLQEKEFLGNFEVKFIINKDMEYDDISNQDKLNLVLKFLEKVFSELKNSIHPKKGSDFTQGRIEQFFSEPKTKTIKEDSDADRIFKEYLENENWYVLDSFNGTSEEKELIKFIKNSIGNIEAKHDEVYLLRNEEVYKIFDFKQGRGFQPDFILFLKGKDSLKYQIFIEPKGNDYIGDDGTFKSGKEGWKEEFLEEISNKYGFSNIIKAEHPNYRLIGLPFFNKDHNSEFNRKFETIID